MNYSKRAYNAKKIIDYINKQKNSDNKKEWHVVFNDDDANDDNYNYIIFNLKTEEYHNDI